MKTLPRRPLNELRSQRWFAPDTMRAFAHRQRLQQMGLAREAFMGRPFIGIINTWSELSPCHAHLRERAQSVARGILAAGGFPFELPAISLGEVMVKPTTMLYRNFLAMECEELLRSLPIDGAVLLGGCDKTTPGMLMGAISMDIPVVFCPAGTMLNDRHRGKVVGAGTHTRIFWDAYQTGRIGQEEWHDLESRMTRSPGTCNTMGTASTMTLMVEAMGLCLSGAAAIPAMDAAHSRMAWQSGKHCVDMVWHDVRPSRILTPQSFHNALTVWMAAGGSTNAAIHIIALAKRAGIPLSLADMDAIARKVPVLVNLFPAGAHLMEDFYYAGGLPALLSRLTGLIEPAAITVTGLSLGEIAHSGKVLNDDVIRPMDNPVSPLEAFAVLHGNLCPDGAVIKPFAASPHLLQHRGVALVFDSYPSLLEKINDPALEVDANTVLILRNAGPVGAPGMPEWGALPIPVKLMQQGIHDMLRLSDCRMSGTHFGSCILHIAPEAATGGPLSLVQTGDLIVLDYQARTLNMQVSDTELAQRKQSWQAPSHPYVRGYTRIYLNEVEQADRGADFKSLTGTQKTPEPSIF